MNFDIDKCHLMRHFMLFILFEFFRLNDSPYLRKRKKKPSIDSILINYSIMSIHFYQNETFAAQMTH